MISARDPQSSFVFDGESMTAAQPPSQTDPRSFVCIDPGCTTPLVWKPGNGANRPHWAHKTLTESCAGARMSVEHLAMQKSVEGWTYAQFTKREQQLNVPFSNGIVTRTLPERRADVAIKIQDPSGAVVSMVVECQNSPSSRVHEELRISDLNLVGLPVMLVVSPKWIVDRGDGTASVAHWVRDWAHRHGRRQIGVIDDGGVLWWVKFTGTTPLLEARRHPVERVRVDLGRQDATGDWELGLCVDTTRPQSHDVDLLIAAPAWLHRHEHRAWPQSRKWRRRRFHPERLARADYLGSVSGWARFAPDDIVTGGFKK